MKNTRGTIWAGVTLLVLLAGCDTLQNLQKPKASLKGVKLDNISLESANLLFDVEIENPYAVALPIVNIDYGVTSNANNLFAGKADIAGTVPANGTKMLSLPVKVTYMDLVKAFKGVRPGSKIPYQADVGLSVNAPALGVLRLPLNKTGELDVPAVPKVNDIEQMLLDKIKQP
jgi:LEA14-like dessication related protein